MPIFRKQCDIYQGYNFKKDQQTTVGFLTGLTIGDTDLVADQICKDPTNPTTDLAAVAVLRDIQWELGNTDSVLFAGQVSVANKQSILMLIYTSMTNVLVVFQFSIYEYDPLAKKYFLCFHSNQTNMNGLLEKTGNSLNLTVGDDVSTEVQSPENYAMTTAFKAQPTAQALSLAVGDGKNMSKPFGLKSAGS
jgi:hypothetical protein